MAAHGEVELAIQENDDIEEMLPAFGARSISVNKRARFINIKGSNSRFGAESRSY